MAKTEFITEAIEQSRESWKIPHKRAMACRDLEEELRNGLEYFRAIRLWDETWSRRVQASPIKYSEDVARQIRGHYEAWFGPCDEVLSLVEKMERELPVEGAEEFRKARLFVKSLLRVPLDTLIAAMQDINQGRCEPIDGVLNELDAMHNRNSSQRAG